MNIDFSFAARRRRAIEAGGNHHAARGMHMAGLINRAPFLEARIESALGVRPSVLAGSDGFEASLPENITRHVPGDDQPYSLCGQGATRNEALADLYYRMTMGLGVKSTLRKWLNGSDFIEYGYAPLHDAFFVVNGCAQEKVTMLHVCS